MPPPRKTSSGINVTGLVVAAVVLCVIGGAIWVGMQVFGEKAFKVGDCVEMTDRTFDSDLTKTSCPDIYDPTSNVYEIIDVIDGDGGYCSYADITFSHEPHDKTYCLVTAGSLGD